METYEDATEMLVAKLNDMGIDLQFDEAFILIEKFDGDVVEAYREAYADWMSRS